MTQSGLPFVAAVMVAWASCSAGQGILEDARCEVLFRRDGPRRVVVRVMCWVGEQVHGASLALDEAERESMPFAVGAFARHARESLPPGAVLHAGVA